MFYNGDLQVFNVERDITKAKTGEGKDLVYKTLAGLKDDLSRPLLKPKILEDTESSSESSDDEEENDEDDKGGSKFVNSARQRDESPESKKASHKLVNIVHCFLLFQFSPRARYLSVLHQMY